MKKIARQINPAESTESISDRAWKTANLAAILAARYPVPHGQPSHSVSADGDWTLVRNEADPELDGFYLSLLRRAQFLLAHAEARIGQIHAWQLFDPRRRFTVTETLREFKKAGWRGLTSENSVRTLLNEIRQQIEARMSSEIEHLLRGDLDPEYIKRQTPKLSQSERKEIEKQITDLQNNPDRITDHNRITASIKEQIALLRSRQTMYQTVVGGADGGYVAFALFAQCEDMSIMDEKLWHPRSDLSRAYPL
ncbi:MAG: hypothetical protein QOD99_2345 [Chthoniobacter sp.]|jgi:hypothetical protein|nr:hypothetical protein [Chthoniobacter sp.]